MARRLTCNFSLQPELAKRIDAAAKNARVNRSAFIVAAVEAYLDQAEAELKLFANDNVRNAWMKAMQQPGVLKSMAEAMGHELSERDRQKVLKFMDKGAKR